MKFHPLAELFPLLEGQPFEELVADIKANGLHEPIIVLDDMILDGRNRWRACEQAGIAPELVRYEGDTPAAFVWSLNKHRRHMTPEQLVMTAARFMPFLKEESERRQKAGTLAPIGAKGKSSELAANQFGVSARSVERAREVLDHGAPELIQAVERGEVSVSAAADVAELPKDEQAEIVARGEREILEAAKAIRQKKAEVRREENARLAAAAPPPPDGKYRCIVIDPPWEMKKIERDVSPNQVDFDYPTMTEEQLASFAVGEMADTDCHLFCWTTHKHLPQAFRLLDQWGFRYVCTMVWHKSGGFQPFGLPQYNCEFVLYARRGSPEFVDTKAFFCCFEAPRREHSRKPDEFYEVVKRVTAGPRIDVFSREDRDGFDQHGNETRKFAA
jgi:N6-adenosine-specific RNA methylase IME4